MSLRSVLVGVAVVGISAAMLEMSDGTSDAVAAYTQVGNSFTCSDDASAATLFETGGTLVFNSDSLNQCALACDCRQGCKAFTWFMPPTFDKSVHFVIAPGEEVPGDSGKCTHYSGSCVADDTANEAEYSFTKDTATDNAVIYPRTSGASTETELVDQIFCVTKDVAAVDGYVQLGAGGANPGVCASGGGYAKLDGASKDLSTGGTFAACKTICDAAAECKMFNLSPDGLCKFRTQRCQTQWVTGDAQPYTSYLKAPLILDSISPTSSGAANQDDGAANQDDGAANQDGSSGGFSGASAASLAATTTALLVLAVCLM